MEHDETAKRSNEHGNILNIAELILSDYSLQKINQMVSFDFIYDLYSRSPIPCCLSTLLFYLHRSLHPARQKSQDHSWLSRKFYSLPMMALLYISPTKLNYDTTAHSP